MRLSYLAYTFSLITKYLGIVMLVPIVIAFFYKEYSAIFPFFVSFLGMRAEINHILACFDFDV